MCSSLLEDELFSLSFDSLHDGDVGHIPWYGLVRDLSNDKIEKLKAHFVNESGTEEVHLEREEFEEIIRKLFENDQYAQDSKFLFDDIIGKSGGQSITWNIFVECLIENLNPKINQKVTFAIAEIKDISHAKRETICKIVQIETDKFFCYALIAKHGRVGLYDGNMNFLTSYHVIMTREDITRNESERRRRNRWITDAIYCSDVQMFLVTNTARTIAIYEASGMKHVLYWLIIGIPDFIQCLTYKNASKVQRRYDISKTQQHKSSVLFSGCFNGDVIVFSFLHPQLGLLRRKYSDRISIFYWNELLREKEFVELKITKSLHSNSINQIHYESGDDSITTCSNDSDKSVIRKFLSPLRESQIYKIPMGCTSFALSHRLKLLVTGSTDGVLRIWNSLLVSSPIASFDEHRKNIVDVQIMTNQMMILSFSADGVLKIWDILEQKCIQNLRIRFPSFRIAGKSIEFGIQSIYPGPKRVPNMHNNRLEKNKHCFSLSDVSLLMENIDDLNGDKFDTWDRSNLVLTCCEHFVIIRLTFKDVEIERSLHAPVLPPPPLQNSVLIPSGWRIQESDNDGLRNNHDGQLESKLQEVEFILNKDLLDSPGAKSDINYKIAILEENKMKMQYYVAKGAPYLALDLHDIEELKLRDDLPIPNTKTAKKLRDKLNKSLTVATRKDEVFTESTSSHTSSSRSSIVDFPY